MARFMALHTMPDMTKEKFESALKDVKNWRPDRRTTIVKIYCNLDDGKMVSECEAVEQAHFEDWLKQVGWPYDSIHKVDLVHQVGHIWEV
jgi:hypothetical protein